MRAVERLMIHIHVITHLYLLELGQLHVTVMCKYLGRYDACRPDRDRLLRCIHCLVLTYLAVAVYITCLYGT